MAAIAAPAATSLSPEIPTAPATITTNRITAGMNRIALSNNVAPTLLPQLANCPGG